MAKLPKPKPAVPVPRKPYFRIIPSQFPPISVFEQLYETEAEREIAFELESLTNPRLRAEAGEISLVRKGEWVSGPGASIVMAAFTHIGKPSRFTDGTFGVYYAAESVETAVEETKYHRAKFLASTNEPDQEITMRVYACTIKRSLDDLRPRGFRPLMDPDDYTAPQAFGAERQAAHSWGVLYPSVRRVGGECVGIFRPKGISIPKQRMHLRYVYRAASRSITEVFKIAAI